MQSLGIFHYPSLIYVLSSVFAVLLYHPQCPVAHDISFLILSLLVTPSIFRRHVISNTLSLDLSFSFSVHVSELFRSTLFTNVSYTRIFVCLLSSLDVHILFSLCSMPLANPILHSISFPDPSLVLIFPPRYTKFSVCFSYCPFTLIWNVMFPFPRNWISVFAAFVHIPNPHAAANINYLVHLHLQITLAFRHHCNICE